MPMTCLAIQLEGAFHVGNLVLRELPLGELAPHHVRVAIRAASLNFRDLLMVRGVYNPKQPTPLIPCSDGAGEVLAVGANVRAFKVGDRVTTCFFQDFCSGEATREKMSTSLGGPIQGTLRTVCDFLETGLVHTPSYLTDGEAATLPCAALTAWNALVEQGNVKPGQTILLQGTGGVSIAALQIARELLGAQVILLSRSAEKLRLASAYRLLGAIDTGATPDWSKAARALTPGGRGVDHVVDVGGADTLQQSIRALRPGGTVSVIGVLSGAKTELQLTPMLMQNLRLQGVLVGTREMQLRMNAAYTSAAIKPIISQQFSLAEARQAFAALALGAHFGKVVIRVDA